MENKAQWLFIEPYVHLLRKRGNLLLYNTLSKVVLEFQDAVKIAPIADELLVRENGYVARIGSDQLKDQEVADFILQLRERFMGDLLDPSWSDGKPVNIFPEPSIKYGFIKEPPDQSELAPGLDVRNYLQEVTLFLNSESPETAHFPASAFRQFSYPGCVTDEQEEMDLNLFRAVTDDINQYTPTLIHIAGSNLLRYPCLEHVISKLKSSPFQKKYHLHMDHWDAGIIPFILQQKQTTIALYITFPTRPQTLAGYLQSLPDMNLMKKLEFNFVVSHTEELQMSLEMIRILDLENVFFKPLFTGDNLDFFKENVFVSKEEILSAQPSQQQVFSRISVNENDFGKLSILPGGDAYANVNDPSIGSATNSSLNQLVTTELTNGVSWRRTRPQVSPCRDCLYQFLCPPISSYENLMKRFNFCDVYPNNNKE